MRAVDVPTRRKRGMSNATDVIRNGQTDNLCMVAFLKEWSVHPRTVSCS